MMIWPWQWFYPPKPTTPPQAEPTDHYWELELLVAQTLTKIDAAMHIDPDNDRLTRARNNFADAYIALRQANQVWERSHPREDAV
jgi:hypothetical protein